MVCPMVLFGHTHAKVRASEGDPYPSWIPYACGYMGSYALGLACFMTYGVSILNAIGANLAPNVAEPIATSCGSLCLGIYAGHHRSAIRNKYNISGSRCGDMMVHALVSPCALCQEAEEINAQSMLTSGVYIPVTPHEPFAK